MLEKYYDEMINIAKEYLEEKYPLKVCNSDDQDYPKNIISDEFRVFKFNVKVLNKCITLLIAFPTTFPDALPKIYLSHDDYHHFSPLPHIDVNRFICTRDPGVVSINQEQVGEATLRLIEIAINIIEKGLKKEGLNEVLDEFLAYWSDKCDNCFLSIINPPQTITRLKLFSISEQILGSKYIIAHNGSDVVEWLKPFNVKIKEPLSTANNILFLPLDKPPSWPLPSCNGDILKLLETNGNEFLNAVDIFLKDDETNTRIIFSFKTNSKQIIAGWEHLAFPKDVFNGSFRSLDKIPVRLIFNRSYSLPIKKIQIERLDKARLFQRVGMEMSQSIDNFSVALIGCGSLGSPLAVSLLKSGISNFLLVDKDDLSVENPARHVCGIFEASHSPNKAEAVKLNLLRHFPFAKCTIFKDDVLKLLRDNEKLLSEYGLIVIATGHRGTERRLNYLMYQGVINSPLLYIWIEAYGVAGQILYINKNFNGCYNCCFGLNGDYNYTVVKDNPNFQKREAGCQSTFIPYSNIDIEQFIPVVSRTIINIINNPPKSNLRYTWLNDIRAFENMGFKIHEKWVAEKPFSLLVNNISKNENCNICCNS